MSRARWAVSITALLALWCLAGPAHAGLGDAFEQIGDYQTAIVDRVTDVVRSAPYQRIGGVLFMVMAAALFLMKCAGWALRGFQIDDMMQTLMQILLTGAMMAAFTTLVPAIFDATLYVGHAMLSGLTGIRYDPGDAGTLPRALVRMMVDYGKSLRPDCSVSFDPLDWFGLLSCVKGAIVMIVATILMSITMLILCLVVMLVDIWGFWIYAIALATGPLLLPFTLYTRLAFLFEGWVRFFFGVVIYVIVARVNLALVAIAIMAYQRSTVAALVGGGFVAPVPPPIRDLASVLGMMLFAGVGIFTLLSTGKFASAIVAGAAAGGLSVSRPIRSVQRVVVKVQRLAGSGSSGGGQRRHGGQSGPGRGNPGGQRPPRGPSGNGGRQRPAPVTQGGRP